MGLMPMCITYLPHCYAQISDKKSLGTQFEGPIHPGEEGMAAEAAFSCGSSHPDGTGSS